MRLRAIVTYLMTIMLLVQTRAASSSQAPQSPQTSPSFVSRDFSEFTELRNQILNLMGLAQNRIVIVTDFLSDGEISTALFLAKYRKIQVRVFLGQKKA